MGIQTRSSSAVSIKSFLKTTKNPDQQRVSSLKRKHVDADISARPPKSRSKTVKLVTTFKQQEPEHGVARPTRTRSTANKSLLTPSKAKNTFATPVKKVSNLVLNRAKNNTKQQTLTFSVEQPNKQKQEIPQNNKTGDLSAKKNTKTLDKTLALDFTKLPEASTTVLTGDADVSQVSTENPNEKTKLVERAYSLLSRIRKSFEKDSQSLKLKTKEFELKHESELSTEISEAIGDGDQQVPHAIKPKTLTLPEYKTTQPAKIPSSVSSTSSNVEGSFDFSANPAIGNNSDSLLDLEDRLKQTSKIRDQNEEIMIKKLGISALLDKTILSPLSNTHQANTNANAKSISKSTSDHTLASTITSTRSGSTETSSVFLADTEAEAVFGKGDKKTVAVPKFVAVAVWPHKKNLPDELQVLETLFQALDHILAFSLASNGIFNAFHRIKKWVENSSGHSFSLTQLSQIRYLFPNAYICEPTKVRDNERLIDSVSIALKKSSESSTFSPAEMELRRNHFRKQLEKFVLNQYLQFSTNSQTILSNSNANTSTNGIHNGSLDLDFSFGVSGEGFNEFLKGHVQPVPSFDIHSSKSSSITSVSNSEAPQSQSNGATREDRGKTSKISLPRGILEKPAGAVPVGGSEQKEKPTTKANQLLARIRAKQQQKEEENQSKLREKQQQQQQNRATGLGDQDAGSTVSVSPKEKIRILSIVDCLNFIFGIEGKTVLPLVTVISKIVDSITTDLSSIEVQQLIVKLASVAPEWLAIETITSSNSQVASPSFSAGAGAKAANTFSGTSSIVGSGRNDGNGSCSAPKSAVAIAAAATAAANIASTSIVRINRATSTTRVKLKIQAI